MRKEDYGTPGWHRPGASEEDAGRRRDGTLSGVAQTSASDASDETVLEEAVRLLRDGMPSWD